MQRSVLKQWYGKPTWLWVFLPLLPAFIFLTRLRRLWQQRRAVRLGVPVIVVGNISVGGTGKTPFIMALARALLADGLRVGIVSRGYGGQFAGQTLEVDANTDPYLCGDEPALLAQSLGCSIVIGRDRVAAAQVLERQGCHIILSDDGLQHYRLARDIEIVLIDHQRQLGNGWCLPLGPLREAASRLSEVDWVIYNGGAEPTSFTLIPKRFRKLATHQQFPLTPWPWGDSPDVDALAGIGNPERFFTSLEEQGLVVHRHPLPDHHQFCLKDFAFSAGRPLLITAKDAVKCRMLAPPNTWVLDVEAQIPTVILSAICARIQALSQTPMEHCS